MNFKTTFVYEFFRLRLNDKFHRAILILKGFTIAYAAHRYVVKDLLLSRINAQI